MTLPPQWEWPAFAASASPARGPTRTVGATVVLVNGALAAYVARGDRQLLTYLPDTEPERSKAGRAVATALIERARAGGESPRGMLLEEIDGVPAAEHPFAALLKRAGFIAGAMGMQATYASRASGVGSRESISSRESARPSTVPGHTADARRPSRSAVSSPFSRRVFERDE
jgi:ATP-dependent helicase Lhr and Lhr-like helicase